MQLDEAKAGVAADENAMAVQINPMIHDLHNKCAGQPPSTICYALIRASAVFQENLFGGPRFY